jgi:hypothetical protein
VLIHGTLPPAHLHARRWWEDRHLRALSDGADHGERWPRRKRLRVGQ